MNRWMVGRIVLGLGSLLALISLWTRSGTRSAEDSHSLQAPSAVPHPPSATQNIPRAEGTTVKPSAASVIESVNEIAPTFSLEDEHPDSSRHFFEWLRKQAEKREKTFPALLEGMLRDPRTPRDYWDLLVDAARVNGTRESALVLCRLAKEQFPTLLRLNMISSAGGIAIELGRSEDEQSLKAVLEVTQNIQGFLDDPDPEVRKYAKINVLEIRAERMDDAERTIEMRLARDRNDIDSLVVLSPYMGREEIDRELVPAYHSASDPEDKARLLRIIADKVRDEGHEVLDAAFKDPSPRVRVTAIASTRDPRHVPTLAAILDDPETTEEALQMKNTALKSLFHMDSRESCWAALKFYVEKGYGPEFDVSMDEQRYTKALRGDGDTARWLIERIDAKDRKGSWRAYIRALSHVGSDEAIRYMAGQLEAAQGLAERRVLMLELSGVEHSAAYAALAREIPRYPDDESGTRWHALSSLVQASKEGALETMRTMYAQERKTAVRLDRRLDIIKLARYIESPATARFLEEIRSSEQDGKLLEEVKGALEHLKWTLDAPKPENRPEEFIEIPIPGQER